MLVEWRDGHLAAECFLARERASDVAAIDYLRLPGRVLDLFPATPAYRDVAPDAPRFIQRTQAERFMAVEATRNAPRSFDRAIPLLGGASGRNPFVANAKHCQSVVIVQDDVTVLFHPLDDHAHLRGDALGRSA